MGRFEEYRTRLGNFLDIPQNTFGKTATVEIKGFCETMVEGCSGILDYSPSSVVLASPQGKIIIAGKDLRISVFSDDRVVIFGTVENVSKGEYNGQASL